MELTRLQKGIVLSCLVSVMEKLEIEINLKPSEAMKIMSVVVAGVEHLSEAEQDRIVRQAYQDAARKLYDSLVG